MSIGENLRNIREIKGYTQRNLAEKAGITQSMLAQLERGTKTMTLPTALSLAEILECSVLDFVQEQKGA